VRRGSWRMRLIDSCRVVTFSQAELLQATFFQRPQTHALNWYSPSWRSPLRCCPRLSILTVNSPTTSLQPFYRRFLALEVRRVKKFRRRYTVRTIHRGILKILTCYLFWDLCPVWLNYVFMITSIISYPNVILLPLSVLYTLNLRLSHIKTLSCVMLCYFRGVICWNKISPVSYLNWVKYRKRVSTSTSYSTQNRTSRRRFLQSLTG